MPDAKDRIGGSSSFVLGADGYTQSTDLGEQEYVSGMNVVCRGGIAQTRPGTRTLFCLPDGNLQGCTLFTPNNGVAHIVAAVDGKIYVSPAPFTSYRRLWDLQFSATSKYVAFCSTLRSAYYNEAMELQTFDNPYSVLIMQDGVTRAAYWDGSVAAHLNPAKPPYPDQAENIQGYNQTPIGLWMIWSGNRLWVSRENIIIPGDIGDPLTFTEATFLAEVRKWTLSGPCTGMIEVPPDTSGGRGFVAFTEKDGTLFNSYIQDRTQWFSTDNFQNTILPTSGCVAPRSLVTQYGLTWWFGSRGIVNANTALRQNLTSRIDYQDNQMFPSKAYLGPDLSMVCASYYENYLMMSVPSGDVKNRHTWVLDQAPFKGNVNAWVGYWTGWRPVEWCRGIVNGSERVFFASIDYDGRNRMWEAMIEERTDNGCPITCYLQTREHTDNDLSMKRYNWSKFFLSQILGDVDLSVYAASTKGGFQKQKDYHIVADKGQVYADVEYSSVDGPFLVSNRPQTRLIRTPSANGDDECNACGVESTAGNMVDYAFSHLLVWSGQMGVRAYQMWMLESPERNAGDCEEDEVSPRTLNDSGCSGLEVFVDTQVFETFEGTAEGIAVTVDGQEVYVTKTAVSAISAENAQAMAECAVQQSINVLEGDAVNTSCITGDGIVVVPPIVPDAFVLETRESSGTPEVVGYEEYETPSSPPKYYSTETKSGTIYKGTFTTGDCTTTAGTNLTGSDSAPTTLWACPYCVQLTLSWNLSFDPVTQLVTLVLTKAGGREEDAYHNYWVWGVEIGLDLSSDGVNYTTGLNAGNANSWVGDTGSGEGAGFGVHILTVTWYTSSVWTHVRLSYLGKNAGTGASLGFDSPGSPQYIYYGVPAVLIRDDWSTVTAFGGAPADASERYTGFGEFPLSAGGDLDNPADEADYSSWLSTAIDSTIQKTTTASGSCEVDGSGTAKATGSYTTILSDEYTDDDAVAEYLTTAVFGEWHAFNDTYASYESRTSGSTFSYTAQEWRVTSEGNLPMSNYNVLVEYWKRAYGSSGAFVYDSSEIVAAMTDLYGLFQATGSTPVTKGYEMIPVVSNPPYLP